jgi:hypothetical protein
MSASGIPTDYLRIMIPTVNVRDGRCNLSILISPYNLEDGLLTKIYGNPRFSRDRQVGPVNNRLSNRLKMTIIYFFFPLREFRLFFKNLRHFRLTTNFCQSCRNIPPYAIPMKATIIISFRFIYFVPKILPIRRLLSDFYNNSISILFPWDRYSVLKALLIRRLLFNYHLIPVGPLSRFERSVNSTAADRLFRQFDPYFFSVKPTPHYVSFSDLRTASQFLRENQNGAETTPRVYGDVDMSDWSQSRLRQIESRSRNNFINELNNTRIKRL